MGAQCHDYLACDAPGTSVCLEVAGVRVNEMGIKADIKALS